MSAKEEFGGTPPDETFAGMRPVQEEEKFGGFRGAKIESWIYNAN